MSIIQGLNFDNGANFSSSGIEFDGVLANLLKINNTGKTFSQAFAADTGFTYDSAKAEFAGGLVRQKDQRPFGAMIGATYTSSKNANWGYLSSLLTAVDTGTPILNAGKLECFGGGNNSVRYENSDIGLAGSAGALKIKYTPNYSGTPVANYNIAELAPVSGNNDRMVLFHSVTGTLRLTSYTSVGSVKHSAIAFGAAWSPVAGTEYELELNWDTVAGQLRLFVNGALQGAMPVSSYARGNDADRLYVGAGTGYTVADAAFNDVILYNSVQHTSAYTSGYSISEYAFLVSNVILPAFTYSNVGLIQALSNYSIVEVGSPRYIISGKYWNGTIWATSDMTFAQANTSATIISNISTYPAIGASSIVMTITFDNTNTLASCDEMVLTYTGQKYSAIGWAEPLQGVGAENLIGINQLSTITANTTLKIVPKVNGIFKYWNGTAWITSDGTTQANTFSDFNTNISSLIFASNSYVVLRFVMTSTNDDETSTITWADIEYNFGAVLGKPLTCLCYAHYLDVSGNPVAGATIKFALDRKAGYYKEANNNIIEKSVSVVTDADGYFQVPLIRSSQYETSIKYILTISKEDEGLLTERNSTSSSLKFNVPDTDTQDITYLFTA